MSIHRCGTYSILFFSAWTALAVSARTAVPALLPPATYADAEVSTNVPAFTGLPLESVYDRSWSLLRLTGRGLDAALENFTVSVTPDGTVFIMR